MFARLRTGVCIAVVLTVTACAQAPAYVVVTPAASSVASAQPQIVTPTTGSATAAPPAAETGAIVQLAEHYFDPSSLTVKVGTTVTWINRGQQTHDVHAYDKSFDSPPLGPGNLFSFTFTKPGLYRYYCIPHEGDGMIGQVQVE